MRVTVSEQWRSGVKLDSRAASMASDRSTVGRLKVQIKGAERFATFTRYQEGREALILPPLWRVEVVSLDDSYIVLGGIQRTSERGPLQYQEWRCEIMDKQKQW